MADNPTEEWEVWYPQAGATGLPFARSRVAPTDVMLVHAAPPVLSVTVRAADGRLLAEAQNLSATDDTPILQLTRRAAQIEREDIWPSEADLGKPVLLAGGEVGILKQWWHADDYSVWRWQIELYNHR